MPGLAQLIIDLSLNSAKFTSGINEANKSLKSIDANVVAFRSTMSSLSTLGVIAGTIYGVVKSLDAFVSAASEAEKVENKLKYAVESLGYSWKTSKYHIDQFANSLMETTRFGDEEARLGLTQMMLYTNDLGKAMNATRLAMDMSVRTEQDLSETSRLVGMAITGNTERLGRFLPELKKLDEILGKDATNAEKAAYAMKILQDKFGGTAISEINTHALAVAKLKNQWGEFKEELGNFLIGPASKVLEWTNAMIKALRNMASELATPVDSIAILEKELRHLDATIKTLSKAAPNYEDSALGKILKSFGVGGDLEELKKKRAELEYKIFELKRGKSIIPSRFEDERIGKTGIWTEYGVSEEEYNRIKESHERVKRDTKEWIEEYNQMSTELAKPWPPAEEGFEWVKGISDKTKESIKEIEEMIEKQKEFRDTGIFQTIIPMPPAMDLDYFKETAGEQERINKNIREEISLLEKLSARNRASRDDQKRLNDLKELQLTYQRDIGELTGGITAYYSKLGLYSFDIYAAIDKKIEELKGEMAGLQEEKWEIKPTSETLLKWGQEAAAAKYGKYTGFEWSPEDKSMEGYVVIGDQMFKLDDLIKYKDLEEEIRQQRLSVSAEDNWQYWERITPTMGLTTKHKTAMDELAKDEKEAKFWQDKLSHGFDIMGDAIMNLKDGWQGFFQTMAQGFARLIQDISMAILKAQILSQIPKDYGGTSTTGWFSSLSSGSAGGGAGSGGGFPATDPGSGMGGYASGGIVTRPTRALVGEAGPEAIIPLSMMKSKGGGNTYIFIRGMDTEDIQRSMRRSGAVEVIMADHLDNAGPLVAKIRSIQ